MSIEGIAAGVHAIQAWDLYQERRLVEAQAMQQARPAAASVPPAALAMADPNSHRLTAPPPITEAAVGGSNGMRLATISGSAAQALLAQGMPASPLPPGTGQPAHRPGGVPPGPPPVTTLSLTAARFAGQSGQGPGGADGHARSGGEPASDYHLRDTTTLASLFGKAGGLAPGVNWVRRGPTAGGAASPSDPTSG